MFKFKKNKLTADKMFEKLGFSKQEDTEYVVKYVRRDFEFDFANYVEICHKAHTDKFDGCHCVVFSYDPMLKDKERVGNTNVGMTPKLMKACLEKVKEKDWE